MASNQTSVAISFIREDDHVMTFIYQDFPEYRHLGAYEVFEKHEVFNF